MNIDKLPKWAQDHIKDLQRQRDTAIRALNEYVDNQTPSPFFVDEMECTGESQGPSTKRRYIQTHKMTVVHAGVRLDIYLRDNQIDLHWHSKERHGDVALVPSSYQAARLVSRENMSR